ncbi:MAG: hypothetical protein GXP55_17520 [Deltaproteobacteria bacterium]|nr:hypothetical protein [Deltaproteobacteria bacterium]
MSEWHPTKNAGLDPAATATGTARRVWWLCGEGDEHEWQAAVSDRHRGSGCPFCSGRRATSTNSLAALFPQLASEWHPTRNGELTPTAVRPHSNRKVWWRCATNPEHEWPATICNRTGNGSRCPACAGRRVAADNTLQALYPDVAKQWDVHANGSLAPDEVLAGSNDKVWWSCAEGPDHKWRTAVRLRTKSATGCPFCDGKRASVTNSLAVLFPEVASEWHPSKNGSARPSSVVAGSQRRYWWQCRRNGEHQWSAPPVRRTRGGHGCPYCRGLRVTPAESLAALRPAVAALWHPSKNGTLTASDVSYSSNKMRWWQCSRSPDHEWEAPPNRLTRSGLDPGHGCPHCRLTPRSAAEIALAFELAAFVDIDMADHIVAQQGRRDLDVDILIRDLRIAVEYDGAYWHGAREVEDRLKTARLMDAGWRVIRVRESPLETLAPIDVQIAPRATKEAANLVLRRIAEITGEPLSGLARYLRRRTVARKKEALRYIDELLGPVGTG